MNTEQSRSSAATISSRTGQYHQPVHTSPLLSTPPIFSTSGVQTVSTTDSAKSKRGLEGGNLVSASIQQYIDSRENDEPPSRLHSTLEDDAPITRLSAVGGLKTHLETARPQIRRHALPESSNRDLNRIDLANIDPSRFYPFRWKSSAQTTPRSPSAILKSLGRKRLEIYFPSRRGGRKGFPLLRGGSIAGGRRIYQGVHPQRLTPPSSTIITGWTE